MGLPVPSFWLRSTLRYRFSNKEIYQKCPEDLRGKYQHPELIIYQFQGLMLTTFMCSLLNSPFLPQKKDNFTKRKTLTESKIVFGNAAIALCSCTQVPSAQPLYTLKAKCSPSMGKQPALRTSGTWLNLPQLNSNSVCT